MLQIEKKKVSQTQQTRITNLSCTDFSSLTCLLLLDLIGSSRRRSRRRSFVDAYFICLCPREWIQFCVNSSNCLSVNEDDDGTRWLLFIISPSFAINRHKSPFRICLIKCTFVWILTKLCSRWKWGWPLVFTINSDGIFYYLKNSFWFPIIAIEVKCICFKIEHPLKLENVFKLQLLQSFMVFVELHICWN